jgi:hypothetical protein
MKKHLFVTVFVGLLLFGCVPLRPYVGKSYPAKNSVETFYAAHDVKKDYEIMGKISVVGNSLQNIQEKITEEAKKHGADGAIYSDMRNYHDRSAILTADFIKYK